MLERGWRGRALGHRRISQERTRDGLRVSLLRLRRNRVTLSACALRAIGVFDGYGRSIYSWPMDSLEQAAKDLDRLEQQLRGLLEQCRKLREENQSLQNRQESLVAERAALVAKNEEARSKVEAMINRLKALEQP